MKKKIIKDLISQINLRDLLFFLSLFPTVPIDNSRHFVVFE